MNRVFELNRLPYGGYPGQDDVDRRGKKPAAETEDDPAPAAAPSTKKRKLGTAMGGLGGSWIESIRFAEGADNEALAYYVDAVRRAAEDLSLIHIC